MYISCVIRYKDTNLKAIHNLTGIVPTSALAVSSDTKIQIWKQFTTEYRTSNNMVSCVIRYKDTNLKAIHNGCRSSFFTLMAVSSDTKIQIWKQFTTPLPRGYTTIGLCHPIQRYKFESNSQHLRLAFLQLFAVSSDTKIQIWKQFTTEQTIVYVLPSLCHPIQRYKFESNSQPLWWCECRA